MKRFAQLSIVAFVAISGMLWFGTTPALAAGGQTQQQATECLQKYGYDYVKKHGGTPVTYPDGDTKMGEMQNNNKKPFCFSMNKAPFGNCFFVPGNDRATYYITQCDREPGSNKQRHDDAKEESDEAEREQAQSTQYDGYTDEAAAKSAKTICTRTSCDIIDNYVNPFIRLLSVVVGAVVVIGIVFGAIQVSTSAGDPQKAAKGKEHIRNAIIAVVAYVLLFIVLNWLIPGGIV